MKPMNRAFDPSPISPVSSRSWYSPRKLKAKKSSASSMRSGGMSNPTSPAGASVISFDAAVVEADRQKRQQEMERLYAAVMAQDDRRSQQKITSPPLPPPPMDLPSGSPPEYSRKKPPRLITNAPNLRHLQSSQGQYPPSPLSPSTPKSPVRAIYPPNGPMPPMPSGPTSPLRAEYPTHNMAPVYQPHQDQLYINRDRSASDGSQRSTKKFRKSLKNIKISSPMAIDDNSDGARTPLSPRFYADPGIPPDPPTSRTVDTMNSQAYPATTPGTGRSWRYGDDLPRETEPADQIDQVRAVPHPNPQRNIPRINPPLPASPSPPRSTGLTAPLPFRQADHHSQAPAKTTFLERKPRNQYLGASLGTPRTGLATPYSPYMPFTPLTPVTPRLASRAERRQRMREERSIRGAVVEEDAVKEEGEIWGNGY